MNELIKFTDNIFSMKNNLDKMLEEIIDGGAKDEKNEYSWSPEALTCETEKELKVYLSIPFSKKENIDVSLKDNILNVEGENKLEFKEKTNILRQEMPLGKFFRAFKITYPIKAEMIKASYKDGLLEITIPKAEEAKENKIKID
jgi:HSP20 family protein